MQNKSTKDTKGTKLKPYMVFSASGGSQEGAALAFAHTAREARSVSWPDVSDFVSDYLDVRATLMRDAPWLFRDADAVSLRQGLAHVIIDPMSCSRCDRWGDREIVDGLCLECREECVPS